MRCPNPNIVEDKYCPKCGSDHLIPSTDKLFCLNCEWSDHQDKFINKAGLRKMKLDNINEKG